MLRSSDIIRLPFPPDLVPAGIAVASRRLAYANPPHEPSHINRLRLDVSQASVELAFRRYLQDQRIPLQFEETQPFTEPDRVTLVLGGRRTVIENSLLADGKAVKRLLADPHLLLALPIQIPSRLQSSDLYGGNDLAIFAFAAAGVHGKREELLRAARDGVPYLCSHIMPQAWRRARVRQSQAQLSLKLEAGSPITMELYGLDLQRQACVERINLEPRAWVKSRFPYLSVSCLHTSAIPTARLEIHSPVHRHAYTIMPLQWSNLWIYGQEIILAGYLPVGEIRNLSSTPSQRGVRAASLPELPVASLYPLPQLLGLVSARG